MSGTVLVVDDEPDIRLLVRLMLERGGFAVLEAASGEGALETVGSEDVDLVLLDIRLPGIDGWEVLARLRAENRDHLPVVMMSAHSSEPTLERATRAGSDAYLIKPFSETDLLRVARRWTGTE